MSVSVRMTGIPNGLPLLVVMLTLCATELVITRPPKNATVLENSGLILHCEVSGKTKSRVSIKWFHLREEPQDGQYWLDNDYAMPQFGPNFRIRDSRSLRFKEVRVIDRGVYWCKVESGKESLISDPAFLTVQTEVSIISTTPSDGKLTIPYNRGVRLTCEAAGIPEPSIQWRIDNESITNPRRHSVEIVETWRSKNKILRSVLMGHNLTTTTKFECEAVNQHIGGVAVKHKLFTITVMPSAEPPQSKRYPGFCAPYNGTICSSVLGTGLVYYNTSVAILNKQEEVATQLLEEMSSISTNPMIQERCSGHSEKFICNYMFPPCRNQYDPKPTPICRESCIAVKDLLCYVQWPHVQRSDADIKLPACNNSLPSKWDMSQECTSAGLFEREEQQVTSECYTGRGRWYNGTVNVTRSGKPCQKWADNFPQIHERPPEVYRELESSENFCRNAGAEEDSPWCYIDSANIGERWELCDIPNCDAEKASQTLEHNKASWTIILIITIASIGCVLLISFVAILLYHCIWKRHHDISYLSTPQDDLEIDIQKLPANMSYHCVDEPVRLNPKLQAYEYPRNDIVYIRDIGQGAFGRVFEAKAPNLTRGQDCQLIAVKMLKEDASDDLQVDFEREASLMAEFDHPNIVKFLGVCAIGKPMCLLFEFMTKGDLNDYLRMSSPDQYMIRKQNSPIPREEVTISLDVEDQLDISRQVAAGMVYLSEKCYVHRDLATRNCLISDNLTVKISDFGLARSVHRLEYYKGSDNDAIPIRWMPLESILYNKFSVESDVWSFGVLLWEIFSFALQPYYGMTHEEVVEFLKEGKNLVCPENTPQQMYELMLKCWHRKPSSRPKFQAIHKILTTLHTELLNKKAHTTSEV